VERGALTAHRPALDVRSQMRMPHSAGGRDFSSSADESRRRRESRLQRPPTPRLTGEYGRFVWHAGM
jgi:hypothetical protein